MKEPAELLSYIDAVSPAAGLIIATEHRNEVAAALQLLFEQAALLMNFPLDATIELAPRYLP